MSNLELIFFWITVMIYALASGGYIYSLVSKDTRLLSRLTPFLVAGFCTHCATAAVRYHAVGHLPWAGDYESALMGGWFIIAATLVMGWRNKALQGLAVGTVPLVVLMMGFGYMRNPVLAPLSVNLKSYWLYIHVYFAWLAFCSYVLAMAAGTLYLLGSRKAGSAGENGLFNRLPSLERLDELIFRFVVFGFINDSLMMAAGSIWARGLWGSYWSWDPIESWSLISWLIYGSVIHMRVIFGWTGARMAWMAIAALSSAVIAFFGVGLMAGSLHVFNVQP